MIILGIETSCDETALALIETKGHGADFECRVIDSLVHSQADLHSAYGGVYPSLAKREHGKNLIPLLHKLLIQSEDVLDSDVDAEENGAKSKSLSPTTIGKQNLQKFEDVLNSFRSDVDSQNPELFESFAHAEFLKNKPPIDAIAVTEGPGLEPALWVGINCARMLAALWEIPVIPVNHMEGHVIGSLLPSDITNGVWQKLFELPLPSVALLISGGHTELINISKIGSYEIIGQTKDDAIGEAFDKAARLLGLPYPGGPHLAELSHKAYEERLSSPVKLPRPMIKSGDLDFSFSGLKTAVLYAVRDATAQDKFTDAFKKGLAYEFEQAVAETLDSKMRKAIEKIGAQSIIIGGGVSANHMLRQRFEKIATEFNIPIFLPSRHISGDNALMIALAGALHAHHSGHRELKAHGTKRLGS